MGKRWLPEQLKLLEQHYPDKTAKQLVELLARPISGIHAMARKLGIKKSTEFYQSDHCGRQKKSPVGTTYIHPTGYLMCKVTDGHKAVHIVEWEKLHGPVPKGYVVSFKDGDKKNIDPDNLELITKKQVMERNTVHRYPPELIETMRLCKKLQRAIKGKEDEGP